MAAVARCGARRQCRGITGRSRRPRNPRQQFTDAAAIPAQHGYAQRQGLGHGAAEGFGFAGKLQHREGFAHHFANIATRRRESHAGLDAQACGQFAQLRQIGFAPGFDDTLQQQRDIVAVAAQSGDEFDRLGVALEPGAAPGQHEPGPAGQHRVFGQKCLAPGFVRAISTREVRCITPRSMTASRTGSTPG